jgi:hypothetical protein
MEILELLFKNSLLINMIQLNMMKNQEVKYENQLIQNH